MASLAYGDVFLRLGAAVAAGAMIGLDRELRRKPAALRTLALVSLGSAVFILETVDPTRAFVDANSRVIQGIVTGVGFLGAGSIMRSASEALDTRADNGGVNLACSRERYRVRPGELATGDRWLRSGTAGAGHYPRRARDSQSSKD